MLNIKDSKEAVEFKVYNFKGFFVQYANTELH